MKVIAKWLVLFVGTIAVLACDNKVREKKPAMEQVEIVSGRDTIVTPDSSSYSPRTQSNGRSPIKELNNSKNKNEIRHKSSYDNMRGFDPASEDDMNDNGMSRYMENNDDEGWE